MKSNNWLRVLCVDDDEDSREMLGILLKLLRIEAKSVATAAQALWLIQAERFDLYLLDAWLPGVDGFELCRQIRIEDPQTPILFFTGAAYAADKQKGVEAGANAYVVKPDVDGLLERITKFITPVAAQPTTPLMSSEQTKSLGRNLLGSGSIRLDSRRFHSAPGQVIMLNSNDLETTRGKRDISHRQWVSH